MAIKKGPDNYKPEYCLIVRNASKAGMSISDIVKILGISVPTFYRWCEKYPDLNDSLLDGKEFADKRVFHTLYDVCVNGTETTKTKITVNKTTGDRIETTEIIKSPPQIGALTYWLTCRLPNTWNKDLVLPTDDEDSNNSEHTVTVNVIRKRD